MFNLAEYIRTWVTPKKFKVFGWRLPRELQKLTDDELKNVGEVLTLVTGIYKTERERRSV